MGFYIWFCFKDLVYYCKESCTNHIRANYYSLKQKCTCFLTVLWQRINHQTGNMQDLHGESTRLTYISVLSNMLLLRLCAYINIKKCVSWILKKGEMKVSRLLMSNVFLASWKWLLLCAFSLVLFSTYKQTTIRV